MRTWNLSLVIFTLAAALLACGGSSGTDQTDADPDAAAMDGSSLTDVDPADAVPSDVEPSDVDPADIDPSDSPVADAVDVTDPETSGGDTRDVTATDLEHDIEVPEDTGIVESGLEPGRALSDLSSEEEAVLCEALIDARVEVLDVVSIDAVCLFTGLVNARHRLVESGLEQARAMCDSIRQQCIAGFTAPTCENSYGEDLATWSACSLSVGEVEACRTADNEHVLASILGVLAAGTTCETLDEDSVLFLPSDAVDAACAPLDACD